MLYFEVGDTNVSIELELMRNAVPIIGATVTAAVRNKLNNQFLDFNDNTFKAAGWTTKFQTLTDLNGTDTDMKGIYRFLWNSATPVAAQGEYQFIFKYNDGVSDLESFDDVYFDDALTSTSIASAVWNALTASFVSANSFGLMMKRIKAALLNRFELADGSSGNLIIYDDDTTTPLLTASVTDKTGGAITTSATVPAKRSHAA
jgi:hypothetical protein